MGYSRSRVAKKAVALLLSVATLLGVVGVAMAPSASALPIIGNGPNGKLLPAKPLQAPVDALLSTVKGVQETIAGLQAAVQAITTGVNGDGTPANPGLAAAVQEYIQELAADPANAPTSAPGFVTGALLPPALTVVLPQALALLQKVTSPICPVVGAVASLQNVPLPTIPDYSIFGELAPFVKNVDQNTQAQISKYYAQTLALLLAPATLPPALGSAAGTLSPFLLIANLILSLFKTNWHTTYYPPDGGAPIVHDTAGVMFLPSLIDVDNNLTFDICANMNLDLLGGTGKVTQQIARIPTSDPNMQLDIDGAITIALGTASISLGVGYLTKGSHVPAMFDTTTNTSNNPISTRLNVPGKTFTQYQKAVIKLGSIDIDSKNYLDVVKPPHTFEYSSSPKKNAAGTTIATVTKFVASERVDKAQQRTNNFGLGGLVNTWAGMGATSTGQWEHCVSTNSGYCSNAPDAQKSVETASMHVRTSGQSGEFFTVSNGNVTTCPTDTHLNANRYFYGVKIPTAASPAGHAWVDTDGAEVTGCQAAASKFPATFKAQDRLSTWTGTGGNAQSRTGDITCPAGTLITTGSVVTSGYLCPSVAPVIVDQPTISGDAYEGNVLTANPGAWTPGAPDAPTFTYKWLRCTPPSEETAEVCDEIAGATAKTYKPVNADVDHTLRVVVTGTNLQGSATSDPSAATDTIVTPPAPTNSLLPVVTGDPGIGSGHKLTATTGTWQYFPTFNQQWKRCDSAGDNCVDIDGATGLTYDAVEADEGSVLKFFITGTNPGGSTTVNSVGTPIPGAIANNVPPTIISNEADASGVGVLQDDTMEIDLGEWVNAESFTYQWSRCDGPSSCAPIAGQTNNTYILTADDIGHQVKVTVTGKNGNAGSHGTLTLDTPLTGIVEKSPLGTKAPKDVVDGVAYAAAGDAASTFVGGSFDTAGPARSRGGVVGQTATSSATGTPSSFNARANGDILTAVTDGAKGYYIGGNFTRVLGRACPGFAHIKNTSGTPVLDQKFCIPGLVGEVRAINFNTAASVHMFAIGGAFTLGGHNNLAFFDYNPATLTPIFPTDGDPNGPVNSIANNTSTTFIIGGAFTKVGATDRGALVQEVVTTAPTVSIAQPALPSKWPAGVCQTATVGGPCTGPGVVKVVAFNLSSVQVGGSFTGYYRNDGVAPDGVSATTFRSNAAAIFTTADTANASFGLPAGWAPNPNGQVNAFSGGAIGLLTIGGPYTFYLGGEFTRVGGTYTPGAAVGAPPAGGLTVTNLAEWAITSAAASAPTSTAANNTSPSTSFTPYVNGPVTSLFLGAQILTAPGSTLSPAAALYIGGSFTQAGPNAAGAVTRMRLAKLTARTHTGTAVAALDATWAPAAGNAVYALSGDNVATSPATSSVFAAGKFRVLGGVVRNNLANFDGDGNLTTWDGDGGTNGAVRSLAVKGGAVYAGGDFSAAGGFARSRLAAFNTSGAAPLLTSWAPEATGSGSTVNAIAAKASSLLVGGSFSNVGGAAKANLAEVNDTTGAAIAGFTADTNGPVKVIKVDGAETYVGGSFSNLGANIAKIASATGAAIAWPVSTDGPVNAITLAPGGAYIGGSFANINGTARPNLGLVDPAGVLDAGWTPGVNGPVNALSIVDVNILVGGQFTFAGGKTRVNLALLDAAGTGATTGFHPDPKVGPVYAVLSYAPGAGVFGDFSNTGAFDTAGVAFFS